MYLTTTIHMNENNHDKVSLDILYNICLHSAKLYNAGLYEVRQHFFNTQEYLNYNELYHITKQNENYSLLLTDAGQQILRLVDRDMKSFFALLRLKKYGKYSEKVHLPKYKKKEIPALFVVQGRSVRMKDNKIIFGLTKEFREKYNIENKNVVFTSPKNIKGCEIKELRIVPKYKGKEFDVQITYTAKPKQQVVDDGGYLSIDMGLDNLMACTVFSNKQLQQFLIDGRKLKSINAYYNKTKALLQSEYSKNKGIESTFTTRRLRRLSEGRKNRINDYFGKCVKYLVNICLNNNIGTIVVGYNKGQKQEMDLGKQTNQNFTCIPFHLLRSKLMSACEEYGIKYISQEESYTSKASSIDEDFIPTYGEEKEEPSFSGKRVKRGLYKSFDGSKLNADINGSINILRKYLTSNGNWKFQDSVRAFVNMPCQRINVLCLNSSLQGVGS